MNNIQDYDLVALTEELPDLIGDELFQLPDEE